MAQRVQVLNICDLHEDEATHLAVPLNDLQGKPLMIDLCDKGYGELQEALAPFIERGQRSSGAAATRPTTRRQGAGANEGKHGTDRGKTEAIRNWAKEQGLEVKDRGRIPGSIQEMWQRAQAGANA